MTVTTPRRRVFMPLRRTATGMPRPAAAADPARLLFGKVVLICVLPMFAQTFHYMNEYPAPYFMSKGWPFLTMPLALYGMARLGLPVRGAFLLVLAYALGFTPFISILQLGNGFLDALTTTIKAWPISYYFSFSVVLAALAVPVLQVRRIIIGCGIATYAIMILLFLVAPKSWYSDSAAGGKLLMYELERGYRVYMPMFFGMILLFFLARTAVVRRSIFHAIAAASLFLPQIFVYKQRTAIAAAFVVTAFAVVSSLPQQLRRLAYGLGLVVAIAGLFVMARKLGLVGDSSGALEESLGGSLTVRQNSLRLAFAFLGENPMRWAFGVGATTRFSTVTLNDIFGNHQFFIADLGWVGVVFEYGFVGAGLLAALYISCLVYIYRIARTSGDPMTYAMGDLVLYVLMSSAVYSVVFTPGEMASATALAVYMDRRRRAEALAAAVPAPFVIRPAQGARHVTLGRSTAPRRNG